MRKTSYCRLCPACCGVGVEMDGERVLRVLGDREHPLSQGFTCPKGRRAGELMQGPGRLTASQRRTPTGGHEPVDAARAIAEVAERLNGIVREHGPDAVGLFMGTQHNFATLTPFMARAWFRGLGSRKLFSTMTIDQSAKWLVAARMGQYTGGPQSFGDADVWLLAGTNPLVSVNGGDGDGALVTSPSANLKAARDRGLRLIVVDPRRTETAARADIHLQPRPGHDALLFAGMLHVILREELHDRDFCARYVDGLPELRAAVAKVTPDLVARTCDVPADDLIRAARLFAGAGRGMATTGTGVCMGPHSNVAEHLAACLNVVCGRFLREGEPARGRGVLMGERTARAEVLPADRDWENGFRSRVGGHGLIRGELPSALLPDEILRSGPDRIRALVVSGGNPVLALPDQDTAQRALNHLELLVSIDTRMSQTAQLADYVIAPTMLYERADHTALMETFFPQPFAQYTPALVPPPQGVIEDWQFFFRLASAMGQKLRFAGRDLDTSRLPASEELLDMVAERGRISLNDVRQERHGLLVGHPATTVAAPRPDRAGHRLSLLPPDVEAELEAALENDAANEGFPLRLVVRRMRELVNSLGRDVAGLPPHPYNPAFLHPEDMERLGIEDGAPVTVRSPHGSVDAVAHGDASVRPGVLSMSHGWGSIDPAADPRECGSNVNRLTSLDHAAQPINHMPTMTAVPVTVVPAERRPPSRPHPDDAFLPATRRAGETTPPHTRPA
ncbi:molybdopterin-containing oxidoreductase family protein [Streptomyces viridosporus]|uniref:molybdopterin-containing oxidoreductase family protein n=1 Tax=Streptomyces viridosporus TaxID=67581 RepID=UPI0036F8000C